jgi:predicted nucleic acid-binding protein
MEIVIDTSVLLAVVSGEPSRERAIELTSGHSLVAPGSVHWEIGNALSAMIKRRRVTLAEANACIEAYLRIPIRRIEVDLQQTMAIVSKLPVYAYDAYLLLTARQLGSPLLTLDRALGAQAVKLGIPVLEI